MKSTVLKTLIVVALSAPAAPVLASCWPSTGSSGGEYGEERIIERHYDPAKSRQNIVPLRSARHAPLVIEYLPDYLSAIPLDSNGSNYMISLNRRITGVQFYAEKISFFSRNYNPDIGPIGAQIRVHCTSKIRLIPLPS